MWEIDATYIAEWFGTLDKESQYDIVAALRLLSEEGPNLRRPLVGEYRLAEIRRKQKMTQAELADKMGISQKRVSEVETGRVGSLRLSTLERYAEGIGGKLHVVIEFPNEEDVLLEA